MSKSSTRVIIDEQRNKNFDKSEVKAIGYAPLPAMRGEAKGGRAGKKTGGRPAEISRPASRSRPAPRRTPNPVNQVRTKSTAKAIDHARTFNKRLSQYLETLAHPFVTTGVKTPVNYNPVPSMMTVVARTTYTKRYTVAAAKTSQISLFPGHCSNLDTDAMDGFSYHCGQQNINGVGIIMGPADSTGGGGNYSGIGCITENLTLDASTALTSGTDSTAILPDVSLPFTAKSGEGGHFRWKLVSLGIKLENTTPILNRGGYINSVQLTSPFLPVGNLQKHYEIFPTFNITEDANSGLYEVSWIPRMDDIAFWHCEVGSTNSSPLGAGLIIWINNDTTGAQGYAVQIVANWELAGSHIAAVATPVVLQPGDKSVLEPTVDILRFGAHTAADAPSVAQNVAHTLSPYAGAAGKIVGKFASEGLKSLLANVL